MLSNTYNNICENLDTSNAMGNTPRLNKTKKNKRRSKNKWFDKDCILAKRELNRLTKQYGIDPTNENIRKEYYASKKTYRKLIRKKKLDHFGLINEEILDNNQISGEKN